MSDIHGNKHALEQVLKEVKVQGVEKLLVLGDLVGYYYYPDAVLNLLNQWDYDLIKGNHESILKQILTEEINEENIRKKYGSGHRCALEKLPKQEIERLILAPDQKELSFDGYKALMCHGAPWDPSFYLYPDTPIDILKKCSSEDLDIVFAGHSHYPFVNRVGNTILINAGSVGQLRSVGGLASWVLFDTQNGSFQIKMSPYDVEPLYRAVTAMDPDVKYLATILKRNPIERSN